MAKIDLTVFEDRLKSAVKRAKAKNIIIPTFAQQKNPELIPQSDQERTGFYRTMGYYCTQLVPHHLEK